MKAKLIFGCLFAALSTVCVYADETEPKEEYLMLGDEEPKENEYVFAFADNMGVSYQLICGACDDNTVASSDEEETADASTSQNDDEAERV